ncbi:MAG: DUF892 family protein [Proteobacteria bacterium]|nr:MAG: DUF892 family protein [Pseudomonadota bacterium]
MNESYREWYIQGLQALKSASELGKQAAQASADAATNPELKRAVQEGSQKAEEHARIIGQLLEKAGGSAGGKQNEIMEGICAGNQQVIEAAGDAETRDAAVIASGQIALHYYIAAYGTLASTAKHLGLTEEAAQISAMNDDIKAQDERYTQMAESFINSDAKAA